MAEDEVKMEETNAYEGEDKEEETTVYEEARTFNVRQKPRRHRAILSKKRQR